MKQLTIEATANMNGGQLSNQYLCQQAQQQYYYGMMTGNGILVMQAILIIVYVCD